MSDHYEILGIASDSTPTEVRQRYRALKQLYEDDLGTYGLVDDHERDTTLAAVEAAFAVLGESGKRRQYDQALEAAGHPGPWYRDLQPSLPIHERMQGAAESASGQEPASAPSAVEQDAPPAPRAEPDDGKDRPDPKRIAELDTVIADSPRHGAYLKAVRERGGIDLETVSQALKITQTQLDNLEQHRFEKLPAPVYLKGFLRSYARFLRIDDDAVVRDYLELRESWEELES